MWKIFSVKTIYRTSAFGKPEIVNEKYQNKFDLIEERIITIKARSFDEAIIKGEKEAIQYAEGEYFNPYGEQVRQRYIGSIDIFELFDNFPANIEVFSSTFIVKKTHSIMNLLMN
jgi:hypothetical protein